MNVDTILCNRRLAQATGCIRWRDSSAYYLWRATATTWYPSFKGIHVSGKFHVIFKECLSFSFIFMFIDSRVPGCSGSNQQRSSQAGISEIGCNHACSRTIFWVSGFRSWVLTIFYCLIHINMLILAVTHLTISCITKLKTLQYPVLKAIANCL